MAKKYITTKYGTKIDVSDLTPEQIAKVKSTAQDKGAYGAKGAALADTFRKTNAKTASTPTTTTPTANTNGINTQVPVSGDQLGVNPKTGAIDANKAVPTITGAAADDANRTFQMQNPGQQTDALGNTQKIITDPTNGQTSITQTGGAPLNTAKEAFIGSATDFTNNSKSAVQAAQDANYSYITKNYAQQKKEEMDAAKQELAERGVPLDPSPDSLYGRTLQQIDQKYQGLDDQAKNQAITTGNQTLSTEAGVVGTLGNTLSQQMPTFTPYQGGSTNQAQTLEGLLSTISAADLAAIGLDQDKMLKLKALAKAKSGGGGGSGGSDNNSPIIGGQAPGFNL